MRYSDWPSRLDKQIQESAKKTFVRGEHDCCLFACDCICSMTGIDPAKEFRGKYKNLKEALKSLKDIGNGDIEKTCEYLTDKYNWPEIDINQAQRGDAVLIKSKDSWALGIIDLSGRNIVFADKDLPSGIGILDKNHAYRAWHIE